ncbi:helix-turn-helix domain-containing protein [Photobacterium leiognathi]|uniref:helix-turn-helix domain-containing protein n=1 Tax=Photobacterium leiognathi TaxID=553611 RepID=UPI0005D422D5|nr:helix-turn-helix transcriptional regulator [Photobacterium leiognathi]KJF97426.1 hypothetical protein UB34_12970 [Photobacterium leiognathi]
MIIENLKRLLNRKSDRSLKQLAKDMNIPYTTLHSVLSGKNTNPKLDTILKICDFYKIDIADLSNKKAKVHHVNNLSDILICTKGNNEEILISIKNEKLIGFLPDNAILFFSNKFDEVIVNNYYIVKIDNGVLAVRKYVCDDNIYSWVSGRNISYNVSLSEPLMELYNVRI